MADVTRMADATKPMQITGGPGSGKTMLIARTAIDYIKAGGNPESVLVLTHSKVAAEAMRERITAGLLGSEPLAMREPLVRTVHSYAFGVLRLHASSHHNPPPRLLTSAEQDASIRELLAYEHAEGGRNWPKSLRPALVLPGFAVEVRNLLSRANERGLGPEGLIELGRAHDRPNWVAAGRFAQRAEHIRLLRHSVGSSAPEASAPALDAAELMGAALDALTSDIHLLARERRRIECLLVDDAQHLDPLAAQLILTVSTSAQIFHVAGDPQQSVFSFRGADPAFLDHIGAVGECVHLANDHRRHDDMTVDVAVLRSPGHEASYIAEVLRTAHIRDGVPWSRMAVIARSVPAVVVALRRGLALAGVPARAAATSTALHQLSGAAWMLLVVRTLTGQLRADQALALVAGPIGRADPVTMRRLRRGLRRVELSRGGERSSAELVHAVVTGVGADLLNAISESEAAPLRRTRVVVEAAQAAESDIESVLWAAWSASGLAAKWRRLSLAGGPAGASADRDLDAVLAMFRAAAAYVDALPHAALAGFVDYVEEQQIPPDQSVAFVDSVTILSAHASVGREWDVVAVAGVQEGAWPAGTGRGGIFGIDELVAVRQGLRDEEVKTLSRSAIRLAEERRLFQVATSRARRRLVVTAVESTSASQDLVPSRFIHHLAREHDIEVGAQVASTQRVPSTSNLVAELRKVVCDPGSAETDPRRYEHAVTQLARLAAAGVPGAHPNQWYGLRQISTDAPLWRESDGPLRISPSQVEQLLECPLRGMLRKLGGDDEASLAMVRGNVVHTLAQALSSGMSLDDVVAQFEREWASVELGSTWHSRQERAKVRAMLGRFMTWLTDSRATLELVGHEVTIRADIEGEVPVRISGRIDRLERDADGRAVVIDLKTGTTTPTTAAMANHGQLGSYQVAIAAGAVPEMAESGGGELVFVSLGQSGGKPKVMRQPAFSAEELDATRIQLTGLGAELRGPRVRASECGGCQRCEFVAVCPISDAGRQVGLQ